LPAIARGISPETSGKALQRRAFQRLRIKSDVTFTLSFEARHAAIESGDELAQVVDKCLIWLS
jgi:hypothetical protein